MKKSHVLLATGIIGGSVATALIGNLAGLTKDTWPGWVQAIGSIAALGVAIFVMSQQNKHAAKLLIDADKSALLRRTAAVAAVVDRTHSQMDHSFAKMVEVATLGNIPLNRSTWGVTRTVLRAMREGLVAIPLHELGSYELVVGIHKTIETLDNFDVLVAQWIDDPRTSPDLAPILHSMPNVQAKIDSAKSIYRHGLAELTAS